MITPAPQGRCGASDVSASDEPRVTVTALWVARSFTAPSRSCISSGITFM